VHEGKKEGDVDEKEADAIPEAALGGKQCFCLVLDTSSVELHDWVHWLFTISNWPRPTAPFASTMTKKLRKLENAFQKESLCQSI